MRAHGSGGGLQRQQQRRAAVGRGRGVGGPAQQLTCSSRRSVTVTASAAATSAATSELREVRPGLFEGYWNWRGHRIRYQTSAPPPSTGTGTGGAPAAVVLVHGFGGNADHWRKNTPALAARGLRAYAVDLLGYGFSDKPDPRTAAPNAIYNFDTWGEQLADFIEQVVNGGGSNGSSSSGNGASSNGVSSSSGSGSGSSSSGVWLSCNSVGGLAGLCAAIARPDLVRGVQLINISLRGLHVERQAPWQRPLVAAFQRLLRETPLGEAFFASVATPGTVRRILQQAYSRTGAVTDELVDAILRPGLQPGAARVFLDFISYSGGPLPEALLAAVPAGVPVSILWGAADPWEDMREGRRLFASQPCVTEFVELPGVGHCPQDEAPEVVNPLIEAFVANTKQAAAAATAAGQAAGEPAAAPAAVGVAGK